MLPGDSYVLLADGRARTVRWWSPPEPELPLAEGAARLREAMTAAVDLRVAGRDLVSCDLGGLRLDRGLRAGRPTGRHGRRVHGREP